MRISPVAARYAEALFGLAKRKGALDAVERDVARIASELASPAVAAYMADARIEPAAKRKKLEPLLGEMHELVRNLVHLLFDKRREAVLADFGPAFRRRLLEERGIAEGLVESPGPLEPESLRALEAALGARLEKRVTLKNKIAPELIAGVRVVVENRMLDASALGRLEGLRRTLLEAPLPSVPA